ncbi:MAG: acyl--CoA ligase [Acidimicrobiales bacterium]|nr:acyl--CoA ligase [Acidimicrobiales bacterium]
MNSGSERTARLSPGNQEKILATLIDEAVGAGNPYVEEGSRREQLSSIREMADEVAQLLRTSGIEPGSAVGSTVPTSIEAIAAMFGIWRAGAVFVPVNPRLTPGEQDRLLTRAGAVANLSLDPAGNIALSSRDRSTSRSSTMGSLLYQAAGSGSDDLAIVLTTSGTTGEPKPVALNHQRVLNGIDTVLATLRSGRTSSPNTSLGNERRVSSPNLIPVPLSLWAGIYNVLFALRVGAGLVLLDPFEPARFAAAVREHSIRSSVLAPAMMTMLADDPSITSLEPLRFVRSITAPLSPVEARRFHDRFGVTVLNSYGQTELGGEVIGWSAADARAFGESKLGALGRPHAGVEVIVLDGNELAPAGTDGELCVRSPYVMAGYLDETTRERLTPDGFLRTGDIGHIDDDGFVWLTGRVSDIINRGGLKVFPSEVEEVLRQHPAVADVAVAGVSDRRLGEVPVAFLVPTANVPQPSDDELATHCRSSLAPYKTPVSFEWVRTLPRNDIGKVLRRELVKMRTEHGS